MHPISQSLVVTGITCEACVYKIKHLFEQIAGIQSVTIDAKTGIIHIESEQNIKRSEFVAALKPYPKYTVSDTKLQTDVTGEQQSYYPLFLIFGFITSVSLLINYQHSGGVVMFLHNFMTGFFLVFSFFKLLNIKAFAESFAMYDLLAMRWPTYGLIYPFIELGLGIACLLHFQPRLTYIADIVIMGFGAIGVIKSVLDKRKIRCACLGTVFDLPMSTVTIIENSIMVAVGVVLLII